LNLYTYCEGNPINRWDPSGHKWVYDGNQWNYLYNMANYDADEGNRLWAQDQLNRELYYKWEETIIETVKKIPSTVSTSCSNTWSNDVSRTVQYLKSDEARQAYKQTAGAVAVANVGVVLEGAGALVSAARISKTANVAKNEVKYIVDENKLNHIFGKTEHNLNQFVERFAGDRSQAYSAIHVATQEYIGVNRISGVFEEVINIGGTNITVRGNVIDGVVRIGTAFIP
jgi:hypothetical protein